MANQVGKVQAEIVLKFDQLKGSVDKAVAQLKRLSDKKIADKAAKEAKKLEQAWATAFAVLSVVAFKAARKVNSAFGDMIQTFATFEQSLANTQSVARASAAELLLMEEAARRVGATTRSTASEAANALYYLASAGFSATEAIAALDGVNALAIATQSDLAKTSETVATTIRQYNLETSAATDIANTFTAAITSSLATMDKLAKSFEYVGPIAAGLGLSVEGTTAALQVLYNKGFSGEKAGRGLRTILVNLADSTSVVTKRLGKLGIAFDDINPTVNSLGDIFDTLREHQVDATNAAAIFGKVSGVQLAALISMASDAKGGIIEMEEAVTGTNRAFEAMAIQMDTLQGSIDKLKNAQEALQISTGKGLEPIIRALVDTATDFVEALNQLSPKLLAFGAVTGPVLANSVALGFALKAAALFMAKLGLITTAAVPPLGLIILAITAITVAIAAAIAGMLIANKKAKKMNMDLGDLWFGEIAEEAGIAEEDLKAFYNAAFNIRNKSVFIKKEDIMDVTGLRTEMEKLAEQYGVTAAQALAFSKQNSNFANKAGITIALLEEEFKAASDLKKIQDDRHTQVVNAYQDYAAIRRKELADMSLEANSLANSIAETTTALKVAFQRAVEQQKAFGDEFDRDKTLTDAYNKAIQELIDQGLKFQGEEIQDLIKLYTELQDLYGKVSKSGKLDATIQRETFANLRIELEHINQLEKANLKSGIDYDAAKARSAAIMSAISTLIANDFTVTGGAIRKMYEEFGKLIVPTDAAVGSTQSYIDKLNALIKTEEELIEIEEIRALDKNKNDPAALTAIKAYYEQVRIGLALVKETAALDKVTSAQDQLDDLIKSEKELNELARDRAIAEAEGNKEAIRLIDLYHDEVARGIDLAKEQLDTEQVTEYKEKIEELSKSELELLEIERDRAIVNLEGNEKAIELAEKYFDILKGTLELEETRDANAQAQEYIDKLKELKSTELELIEIERTFELARVKGNQLATDAVNDYFDALTQQAVWDQYKANLENAVGWVNDFAGAIDSFAQARFDVLLEQEDRLLQLRLDNIQNLQDAEIRANNVAEESTLDKLDRQYQDALLAGDADKALLILNSIERQKIVDKYDILRAIAEADVAKATAQIKYKSDLSAWAADSLAAISGSALAIITALKFGPIAGVVMSGLTAIQLATIAISKPKKPVFQNSGIVPGSSYKGDTTEVLANAGELILDRGKQENIANQLTDNNRPINITIQSILDGKVIATNSAKYYRGGQVKL